VDLDALALEVAVGVLAELRRDVCKNPRRRVDEHPALADVPQGRVRTADRLAREIVELCERLDARVPRADEHEAEVAFRLGAIQPHSGGLERPQEVVPKRDRVGDVLEAASVLGEPRDGERPSDRAERHDEPLVADLERPTDRLRDGGTGTRVPCHDPTEKQLGVRAHLPKRDDDVARLQRPGRSLRQQRRVQHEVVRIDNRRAALAQQARDVRAGEAAAHDERAADCFASLSHPPTIARWRHDRYR
jgi:hypothetical protein